MNLFGSRSLKDVLHHAAAGVRHQFLARSLKGYGLHSPALYHLVSDVLANKHAYYAFDRLESLRKKLHTLPDKVTTGTHGQAPKPRTQKLGHAVKNAAMPPRQARLIFRLVNYFQPRNVLELGTGPGITAAYIASACYKSTTVTVEGNPALYRVATRVLKITELTNVRLIHADFATAIDQFKNQHRYLDFLVLDGDHSFEKTMQYLNSLKPLLHSNSVVVVHDIHWSCGMEKAWKHIVNQFDQGVSIDLFHTGILFYGFTGHKSHLQLKL